MTSCQEIHAKLLSLQAKSQRVKGKEQLTKSVINCSGLIIKNMWNPLITLNEILQRIRANMLSRNSATPFHS